MISSGRRAMTAMSMRVSDLGTRVLCSTTDDADIITSSYLFLPAGFLTLFGGAGIWGATVSRPGGTGHRRNRGSIDDAAPGLGNMQDADEAVAELA
jgi:hypothetical protein